jgi:hypothetical protein
LPAKQTQAQIAIITESIPSRFPIVTIYNLATASLNKNIRPEDSIKVENKNNCLRILLFIQDGHIDAFVYLAVHTVSRFRLPPIRGKQLGSEQEGKGFAA